MSRAFVKEQDDAVEESFPSDRFPNTRMTLRSRVPRGSTPSALLPEPHMPPRKTLAIARLWHQHPVTCGTGPLEERPLGSVRRRKIMIGFNSAPR
jgi:hypothetical protein